MKVTTLKAYRASSMPKMLINIVAKDLSYALDTSLDKAIEALEEVRDECSIWYSNLKLDIRNEQEPYYGDTYLCVELRGDRLENEHEFKRRTEKEWHFLRDAPHMYPGNTSHIIDHIRRSLTNDLRDNKYNGNLWIAGRNNNMAGHCYVASEVFYHLMGGKKKGWKPMFIEHEGEPHWFIKSEDDDIVDVTADQFETKVPYKKAIGKGFLTKEPSRRAQILIERVLDNVTRDSYW